jgi:hypothetical protein
MMDFIREGGFAMYYFVLAGAALAAVSALRSATALRSGRAGRNVADGVIFWGGFALVGGVLGTLVGLSQVARVVESAGAVSTSLLWGGIRVTLTTTIAGCVVFVLATSAWVVLRWLGSRQATPGLAMGRRVAGGAVTNLLEERVMEFETRLSLTEDELSAANREIHRLTAEVDFARQLRDRPGPLLS